MWIDNAQVMTRTYYDPPHCTIYYDADRNYAEFAEGIAPCLERCDDLLGCRLMIGREGVAMEIKLTEEQRQLIKYPPGVTSHVTITTAGGYHPKDLGLMVYRLQEAAVTRTTTILHWRVHRLADNEGWICDFKEQVLQGMVEEVNLPRAREAKSQVK